MISRVIATCRACWVFSVAAIVLCAPLPMFAEETEVAYLAGSDAEVSADMTAAAKKCDGGEVQACYVLANRYEEGIGLPLDRPRAARLHDAACLAGNGSACRALGLMRLWGRPDERDVEAGYSALAKGCELGFMESCEVLGGDMLRRAFDEARAAPEKALAMRGAELSARACEGGYHAGCSTMQSVAYGFEQQGWPLPQVEPGSLSTLPLPAPEQACPGFYYVTTNQSGGPTLRRGLQSLTATEMEKLFPTHAGRWKQTRVYSGQAGTAGMRSSHAGAEYAYEDRTVSVSLIDASADCTLQPRTGEAMLALAQERAAKAEQMDVAGEPAIAVWNEEYGWSLLLWAGDRCRLGASAAPPVEPTDLAEVVAGLDSSGVRALCRARQAGFF